MGGHGLEVVGALEAGRAVERAARALHQLEVAVARDLRRALEHQVLEKVSQAGTPLDFVAGADVVPEADRRHGGQVVLGEHHAQTVGKAVLGRCQAPGACLGCGRVTHGHVRPFASGGGRRNRGFPAVPATVCKRATRRRSSRRAYAHSGSRSLRRGWRGTAPERFPPTGPPSSPYRSAVLSVPVRGSFRCRAGLRRPGRGPGCQYLGPQWSASDPSNASARSQAGWPAAARRPRRPTTRSRRRSSTSTSWTRCVAPTSSTRTRSSTRAPCRTPATASSRCTAGSSTR